MAILAVLPLTIALATERLALDGLWRFSLGGPAPSFPQKSLPALTLDDSISLPGTTETRGKGPENIAREAGMLTRLRKFEGPAWYQREIEIPAGWTGQRIELQLERTKYTQIWIDDQPAGEQGVYTAAQRYDVTRLATPGRHALTVMVDNRAERRSVQAEAHQFSDNTQTNWNGVIGQMEMTAQPATWLADVQIYPSVLERSFRLHVVPAQMPGRVAEGRITVSAESFNHPGAPHRPASVTATFSGSPVIAGIDLLMPLGKEAKLWDEFSPALYRVTVMLDGPAGHDERVIQTGLREISTVGTHFAINGRPTFLRGKHDACVFPLTGHPPMDVEGWLKYLGICRSYGLNHIRCHTWVPPEAAFAAADRLGIYLQPELPYWGSFDEKAAAFLWPEVRALLRAYGNHPSFAMMTLGNELSGDRAMMNTMVSQLRGSDPRHLYADGSNNYLWDPRYQATNDFWPTARLKPSVNNDRSFPVRGSFFFLDGDDGSVQWGPASTRGDYREAIVGTPVPVIGHEIAQYTVYPDFREIERYTGVTRARNLELFQESLSRHGMLSQAADFFRASGALAASLDGEEIERALRTPGFGGFQLLDLQDFPGQGTALVGVLNAFMESKGAVTPERWNEFCGPIVPLARFDRYGWTTAEVFTADIEVAQFGPTDLLNVVTTWKIANAAGDNLAEGKINSALLAQGGLRTVGRIEAALASAKAPARYELTTNVTDGNVTHTNRWPVWIYPSGALAETPRNVTVVRAFDAQAKDLLLKGKRVVLIPEGKVWGHTVRGGYATDFWCWPMFGSAPGTMGLLCDPHHPALAQFPTADHSERQWSAIAHASTPLILTETPAGLRPIVQVIDNLGRNEKMGLIFEAKVGAGSLLVVACDLYSLKDDPAARQLLASILGYAGSGGFSPPVAVSVEMLDRFLRPSLATGRAAEASSSFKPGWGAIPTPANAVDDNIASRWQAADDDKSPQWTVDLGRPCDVDTITLRWEFDHPGYRYTISASANGSQWSMVSDQGDNTFTGGFHALPVSLPSIRHLRISIKSWPAGEHAALRDFRVLGHEAVPPL